jgi:pyruvate,water dikinase
VPALSWTIPLSELTPEQGARSGGKALALARLAEAGVRVPGGICLLTDAYLAFAGGSGLAERISLELARKRFEDMRWEELWDAALRIRNAFLRAPWPGALREALLDELHVHWADGLEKTPLAVRSSSPGEDSLKTSFAGLHESYVNVRGAEAILEAVRGVWASLWSDRALLYRQELGLDVHTSAMAVVVQEMVMGDCSGVAFSVSPTDTTRTVVEAVWGLNEGLVDGTVEPDHWELARDTGALLEHRGVVRVCRLAPSVGGVRLEPLENARRDLPPLRDDRLAEVVTMARRAETLFGSPQDVEWTFRDDLLYLLQSRPISTLRSDETGTAASGGEPPAVGRSDRAWFLSLHRSFDSLKLLRERIEGESLPAMVADADRMSATDLTTLSDTELGSEIGERLLTRDGWLEVYWRDFIPFAHGMRLFGQVYNDDLLPEDPFAFLDLLTGADLVSLERNALLAELAHMMADGAVPHPEAARGAGPGPGEPDPRLDAYLDRFGSGPGAPADVRRRERAALRGVLQQFGARTLTQPGAPSQIDRREREETYLARFSGEERAFREELLDLARASYRLRDDDNLYLDRVEAQLVAALDEGKRRLGNRLRGVHTPPAAEIIRALEDPAAVVAPVDDDPAEDAGAGPADATAAGAGAAADRVFVRARQLVGQPAGPGLGAGPARVVSTQADLFAFQAGEVLVCDALDPTMTFVAPLAAAIVERRGGMLIHGAIIAREYGLPCVTGVPMATEVIHTGDGLTVDGYLGIVVVAPGAAAGAVRG